MSIHIPWAEEAQLTEDVTGTSFVGPLRECFQRYRAMDMQTQINVLIVADASVPIPGRSPTKILEHVELQAILAAFDADQISVPDIVERLEERRKF